MSAASGRVASPPLPDLTRASLIRQALYRDVVGVVWLLLAIGSALSAYNWSESQAHQATARRLQSILVANELRQSSDDLTRMVRTYVVTGDSLYKQYFQRIIDIRDGRVPRPSNDSGIYWDFVAAGQVPPHTAPGQPLALIKLMHRAGFTERELDLLADAKRYSDELTRREFEAMRLIEEPGPGREGRRALALQIVHDAAYHRAKAGIMSNIEAVYASMDKRTRAEVNDADERARVSGVVVGLLVLLLAAVLWKTYKDYRAMLGNSFVAVYGEIERIGSGDFSGLLDDQREAGSSLYDHLLRAKRSLRASARERQVAEAKLRQLNQELDQRVQRRTSDLENSRNELERTVDRLHHTQAQLIHSEKLASLGGLVAGLAHEVNTPVGVALTSASSLQQATRRVRDSLAQGGIRKSDLQGYLDLAGEAVDLILRNTERAAQLVLSFKQIAADQVGEERRSFELAAYIAEVVASLRPLLKKRGAEVAVKCSEEIVIEGYPGALAQVLTNLVMNSLTHGFGEDGAALIHIELSQRDEWVRLRFSDNGKGIEPEHLAKVFDPFFTTRRGQGGTGLGLNIAHNIVHKQFGGTMTVSSPQGEGATFELHFPCVSPVPD